MNQPKVRSVQAETIMARDVVLLKTPVMKERVTVMAQETVDSMMVTAAASQVWCAAATTVSSLELTTTPRMTAVRDLLAAV